MALDKKLDNSNMDFEDGEHNLIKVWNCKYDLIERMLEMPINLIRYDLKSNNRVDIRKEIVSLFLLELPGTGKGINCSVYHYTVEIFNNYSVILHRPTGLNKGFDFTVNIFGMSFKRKRIYYTPSHRDIIDILQFVKMNYPIKYHLVATEIYNIYNCSEINLDNVAGITFFDYNGESQPIEIILLAIKWLFIEQDITYWNWSGRAMLFSHLEDLGLV